MKLSSGLLSILSLLCLKACPAVEAQAFATATGPGSFVSVGGGFSTFQAAYGAQKLSGGFVYADVNPQWRVGLEGEIRSLRLNSFEQVNETDYLGGVRVQILRPHRFQPYVKFLAGVGRIQLPFRYAHGNFLSYAPGAGLDIALSPRVTWRAAGLEYQHWPDFPYGALNPYGISTGISFRLNSIPLYPRSSGGR